MSVGQYTCALAIVPGLRAGVAALRYRGAVMSGLLPPDQWDALRNWVGTVGGVVALTIAARTIAETSGLDAKSRRDLSTRGSPTKSITCPGRCWTCYLTGPGLVAEEAARG